MNLVRETKDDPNFQTAVKQQVRAIINKAEALTAQINNQGGAIQSYK